MIQEEEGGQEGASDEPRKTGRGRVGGGAAVISAAFRKTRSVKPRGKKRPKPNFKTIISNQFTARRSETGMGGAGRGEERRREEEADSEEKPFWLFLTS